MTQEEKKLKKIIEECLDEKNKFLCAVLPDKINNHPEPSPKTIEMFGESNKKMDQHRERSQEEHAELKITFKEDIKEASNWMKWAFGVLSVVVLGSGVAGFFADRHSFDLFKEVVTEKLEVLEKKDLKTNNRVDDLEKKVSEIVTKYLPNN